MIFDDYDPTATKASWSDQTARSTLDYVILFLGSPLGGFASLNEDVSLMKRTSLPFRHEGVSLEFRAEFFNLFNHVVFSNPATNFNAPTSFGFVSGQANLPRQLQFGLKVNF